MKRVFYGTRGELAAFLRLNPTLCPDGPALNIAPGQIRQGLKDEAPGVGPGASGAEPTGCSPPSPDHRSEDRPRSEVATTPDLESAFRAYAWWLDGD